MKWNLLLLYCNGHGVANGRTFEDVSLGEREDALRFYHQRHSYDPVCVFELYNARWETATEHQLHFSGCELRDDGQMVYQMVTLTPGREYAADRDPNFLYPLEVAGLSGDHNTGDGIVVSSVGLRDPTQHAQYRLDHDQIVELLHRLHQYGRTNFEHWLRKHILKETE